MGAGETVEFDVVQSLKGTEATHVTGPGGIPVQGRRHATNRHVVRRNLSVYLPVPSRGQQGSNQHKADRGRSNVSRCFYCGRFMNGPGLRLSPWKVEDREVHIDLTVAPDSLDFCCGILQCPESPHGPRSSDDQEGDKDTSDLRPGDCFRQPMTFCYPKCPERREMDRDDALATDRPPF